MKQNEKFKDMPTYIWTTFNKFETIQCKTVFSTNSARKIGCPYTKNKLQFILHILY